MTPAEYADRCRAGISRLREQAQAATPGQWRRREGTSWIDAGDYDEVIAPAHVECGSYCYGGSSQIELSDADAAHIATWSGSSVLLVLDGWERQLKRDKRALEKHVESGYNEGDRQVCECGHWMDRCADRADAEASIADLARLVDTINGETP